MVKTSEDKVKGERTNDCRFKGVRKRKWGKWVSEIRLPNSRERIWLGSYDTPEKAARAFDAATFCLHGPAAKFNFPANPPTIPGTSFLCPAEIQVVAAKYANEGLNPPEREQSMSDLISSPSLSPSLVSDEISTNLNPELDWSCRELLTADSGEKRSEFENPVLYFDQFAVGYDFSGVSFGEELVLSEEPSFLWSF